MYKVVNEKLGKESGCPYEEAIEDPLNFGVSEGTNVSVVGHNPAEPGLMERTAYACDGCPNRFEVLKMGDETWATVMGIEGADPGAGCQPNWQYIVNQAREGRGPATTAS